MTGHAEPRTGSPRLYVPRRPCRLCAAPTQSRYGICLAHSDLTAALDLADGLVVESPAMDAALQREAAQAARERGA